MKKIEGRFFISFSSQLSSGDASDSICPKGWGMGKYSGDRSYQRLFLDYYSANANKANNGFIQKYNEYDTKARSDEILMQLFTSFMRYGDYDSDSGIRNHRASYGQIWENKVSSKVYVRIFLFLSVNLEPQTVGYKTRGLPLRCVAKYSLTINNML